MIKIKTTGKEGSAENDKKTISTARAGGRSAAHGLRADKGHLHIDDTPTAGRGAGYRTYGGQG